MLEYENTPIFNYMTKNRKLKLEEYDDEGNLIDAKEFDDKDLFDFCLHVTNGYEPTKIARKEDLDEFSVEELKIINRIFFNKVYDCYSKETIFPFYWFTNKTVEWFKTFFKTYTGDEINFALEIVEYNYSGKFNVSPKSPYFNMEFNFLTALKFIKERDGIYFTINNKGERVYDFVDKPTRKQVKYQRVKNGNRCVFLSFKDWKRYLVREDELE